MSNRLFMLVLAVSWSQPVLADPAPAGAISYFDGACPEGWRHYDRAAGRAIVPVGDRGLGRPVRNALQEGDDLHHSHPGEAAIRLEGTTVRPNHPEVPTRDVVLVDNVSLDVEIGDSSANLPTVKFNVCVKTQPAVGSAPAGMVLFFVDPVCPPGWNTFSEANGRFLTGAHHGGRIGAFGAARPLNDGEDRVHAHLIRDPVELKLVEDQVWSGCSTCSTRWAWEGTYQYRGQAKPASSGLPYVQLRACSKDLPRGPQISRVTHAADFQARRLAPGQHATIFGQGLGPVEGVGAALDESGEVSRLRAAVQVLVDEIAAPLFFVREDQINFQIPYEVAGRATVRIVAVRNEIPGSAYELELATSAPALFAWGDDLSRAIAVHADGSLNGPTNPAELGQPVIFYASGEGQTSPPGTTGVPAIAPYPSPLADVQLWIGGEQAILDYAGAAPGFVGLMQINARMTAASGNVPVVLRVGGVSTVVQTSIYGK